MHIDLVQMHVTYYKVPIENHFDSNNMPVLLSIQRKMAIGHGYCSQFVYVEV